MRRNPLPNSSARCSGDREKKMLISLNIQNIALMDRMSLDFGKGLHVLTGETGAGKSIIVDAVQLLLGGRAQKELIRTGESRACVEGVFSLDDCPKAAEFLKEQQLDDGSEEVTLFREITLQGRSSCRVNGTLLNLSQYQQLTQYLMDIHGQHEHQFLMDEKRHLAFLDASGDGAYQALLREVRDKWDDWQTCKKHLDKLRRQSAEAEERLEILRLREKELKEARLKPGEEEALTRERELSRNSVKIENGLRSAYEEVYDGQEPAAEALRRAAHALGTVEQYDPEYANLKSRLENLYYEAEDVGLSLRSHLSSLESDPQRLEEVEARLDLLRRLGRKYGTDSTGMKQRLSEIQREIAEFSGLDDTIEEIVGEEKKKRLIYQEKAAALTKARTELADRFRRDMETQLKDLNMAGTRFEVAFKPAETGENGNETACFRIAPNRGEELQPVSKIASGGELSRLMLAIKTVAAQRDGIPSMIFDEIDTGISGRAAQVVGEKMAALAQGRQVLCVTHLQQIAALADRHMLVEKAFDGERTRTAVTVLTGEKRVGEIARMLGGDNDSARKHAAEMLKGKI